MNAQGSATEVRKGVTRGLKRGASGRAGERAGGDVVEEWRGPGYRLSSRVNFAKCSKPGGEGEATRPWTAAGCGQGSSTGSSLQTWCPDLCE